MLLTKDGSFIVEDNGPRFCAVLGASPVCLPGLWVALRTVVCALHQQHPQHDCTLLWGPLL